MSKKIACAITDNNITLVFDNQTHIVSRSDEMAERLLQALRENRKSDIPGILAEKVNKIEQYGNGSFTVRDGIVIVNGQPVHPGISKKILKFQADKLPHQPLVKFAENLQRNPSFRAVNELFQFLEKNEHPITDEGNFIAYKRVRKDFKDIHSGTFDNSVGTTVEMPRNQVNEDSSQTCSNGLHVANWTYAHTQFASHDPSSDVMLEVEVNPSDVVSIPVDYNQAKMRVCKYKVLGVVDHAHSSDVHIRHTSSGSMLGGHSTIDEDDDSEDEVDSCSRCGADVYDPGYELCEDCELEDEEEEEEEEEEEDEYPWKDEV